MEVQELNSYTEIVNPRIMKRSGLRNGSISINIVKTGRERCVSALFPEKVREFMRLKIRKCR